MYPLVLTSCKPGLDHRAWLNGYTGDVIILDNVKQGSSNINRGFIFELLQHTKIVQMRCLFQYAGLLFYLGWCIHDLTDKIYRGKTFISLFLAL